MRKSLLPPLALAVLGLAGCDGAARTQPAPDAPESDGTAAQLSLLAPSDQRGLAAVRSAYSAIRDTTKAGSAGFVVRATECRDNPPTGGMGYHYLNPDHIAAVPAVETPQILLFAPRKNGRVELAAVEYIVPYGLVPSTDPAPTLLGHAFHRNDGDQVWMLHVWLWRHNPDGLFANWNPDVGCD